MTTFTQKEKNIAVSFGEVHTEIDNSIKDAKYIVTAPKIICDKESDAQYIKDKVNSFVNNLIKDMIKH